MRIELGKKCNVGKSHDALFAEGLKLRGILTFFQLKRPWASLGSKEKFQKSNA